jgi:N-methylhydantoinase A
MVGAIRAVTIERGIDPRAFTLVCGGGAGGLHATELARALGMQRVFVPLEAGVFCAFGMTVTDVRHDHLAALHVVSDSMDLDTINEMLGALEEKAAGELAEEGFDPSQVRLERSVDARYPGQVHEITVPVPSEKLGQGELATLVSEFHDQHRAQFAYSRENMPIECLHWRVAAVGTSPSWPRAVSEQNGHVGGSKESAHAREAYFAASGGLVETVVHDVADLSVGVTVEGPALVTAPTTTIVLHPGDRLTRPTADGFLIEVKP